MKDPLDTKIDALLASRPIRPGDGFAARVLDATEAADSVRGKRPLARIIAFTLPLAAAVVLALSLLRIDNGSPAAPTTEISALTTAEAQEIFLLEEALADLDVFATTDFASGDLLATLDALYLEI
jgi:hypothetical protein